MAYRSSASANLTPTTSPIVPMPATVVAGDVLIVLLGGDRSGKTFSAPGWQQAATVSVTAEGGTGAAFWKIADGSESGGNVTFSASTDEYLNVISLAFSGRSTNNPVVFAQTTANNSNNSSPISIGAVGGTADAGDDVVVFTFLDHITNSDRWEFSAPSGYTEREDLSTEWVSSGVFTLDNVSQGATGTLTATATRTVGGSGAGWGSIVLSLSTPREAPITGIGAIYNAPITNYGPGSRYSLLLSSSSPFDDIVDSEIYQTSGGTGAIIATVSNTGTITTANLTGTGEFSSTINGTGAITTANLIGLVPVSSSINFTGTVNADVIGAVSAISSISSSSTVTSDLIRSSSPATITSTGIISTATVVGLGSIASTIVSSGVVSAATLLGSGSLSSTVASVGTVTGFFDSTIFSNINSTGTVLGALTGTGELSSTVASVGTISTANINQIVNISCTTTNSGTVTCTLTGSGLLTSNITSTGSVSSALTGIASLSSTTVGTWTVNGTLSVEGSLLSLITCTSSVSANLSGSGVLSSSITSFSSIVSNLTAAGSLSSQIICSGNINGSITGILPASCTASYTSSLVGNLSGVGGISTVIASTGTVTGSLVNGVDYISSNITYTSNITGDIIGIANITCIITSTGTCVVNNTGTPILPTSLIYGTIVDVTNTPVSTPVFIDLIKPPTSQLVGITTASIVVKSDDLGSFQLEVLEGAEIEIHIPSLLYTRRLIVGASNVNYVSLF